jgi:hypothetical protein
MKEIIDLLRNEGLRVTIHDTGLESVYFVLAVAIDEPLDIWYVARALPATNSDHVSLLRPPTVEGNREDLLVFHDLKIDAEMYEYICAVD